MRLKSFKGGIREIRYAFRSKRYHQETLAKEGVHTLGRHIPVIQNSTSHQDRMLQSVIELSFNQLGLLSKIN